MGCSTCAKCKWVRNSAFCGTTKLTEKQLYAKNGFCSTYKPKEEEQATSQPHSCNVTSMDAMYIAHITESDALSEE